MSQGFGGRGVLPHTSRVPVCFAWSGSGGGRVCLAACSPAFSGRRLAQKATRTRAAQCFVVVSSLHSDLARSEVMASVSETQAILLVHGPDRKGIVAAFSQTLFGHGCGIVSSEQHTDAESSVFYQRIVFDAAELHTDRVSVEGAVNEVAGRLGMTCDVRWPKPKRVAIFVALPRPTVSMARPPRTPPHAGLQVRPLPLGALVEARRRRAARRRDRADRVES